MPKEITVAIIAAVGGIIVALIGQLPIKDAISARFRSQNNIPQIMGTKWKAEWSYNDGSPSINDTVTLSKWTKDSQFEGSGEVMYDKLYTYSITGEVSPSRVVVLTYKAEKYPTEVNIGTASLLLSNPPNDLSGAWSGVEARQQPDGSQVYKVRGGKLTMHKVN
jgi:hypothetical protein